MRLRRCLSGSGQSRARYLPLRLPSHVLREAVYWESSR
jgi:hypothetical protein